MCPVQCLPEWNLLCAMFVLAVGFEYLGELSRREYFVVRAVAFVAVVAAGREGGV